MPATVNIYASATAFRKTTNTKDEEAVTSEVSTIKGIRNSSPEGNYTGTVEEVGTLKGDRRNYAVDEVTVKAVSLPVVNLVNF